MNDDSNNNNPPPTRRGRPPGSLSQTALMKAEVAAKPEDLGNLIHGRGWVSLREFLKIADVTYPTALRWCHLGMIKYTQVGGVKRVFQEEIARFLREGTLPPDKVALANEKQKRIGYQLKTQNRLMAEGRLPPKGKLPTF